MRQGDLATRKSYGNDIIFRIQEIDTTRAILRGVDFRLLADAPISDLSRVTAARDSDFPRVNLPRVGETIRSIRQFRQELYQLNDNLVRNKLPENTQYFEMPGKILHLDGDPNYLRKSMNLYGELRIPAEGFYVNESQMAATLQRLLPQVKPDIVVVTGHDGLLKNRKKLDVHQLDSYKNSLHFVRAVQVARQYQNNRDALTIVAGACQSHFEALLQAGANFASSPARVLIHALDPLCIAAKASYTSIRETVSMADLAGVTVTGLDGVGGIETRGSYRIGVPRLVNLTAEATI
ncbi:sporulation peptidase YabG [Paenibacillus chitinolyticus]|uniref:Sporulation peptidase YabG n=1 Tax=Paenibacillus chitinolyticus TaxID=79263 RepID=A0A410WQX9_9BACL|nr:sporulation peptidase YabG [Paenibacillus chitinolyticus]MCY9592412.1 sporulation peptidase YabG [Paenibacillus chitinolyticus]MCY9599592.1 sporulation peptidase YabG [Paenibacillus chitinolyticus]QAV16732.1 sporulation peptidase YabG [Paenibacillus chitinolyticus]